MSGAMWLVVLVTVGFALAGVALIVRGLLGVTTFGAPRCTKCGYDLRGFGLEPPTRCTECGADLTRPNAVRYGTRERRWTPAVVGLGVLAMAGTGHVIGRRIALASAAGVRIRALPSYPMTTGPTTAAAQRFTSRRPAGPLAGYTTYGLLSELERKPLDGQLWQEVRDRRSDGRLADADVPKVAETFSSAFLGKASTPSPLDSFVLDEAAKGLIDPAGLVRVARAVHGDAAAVTLRPMVRRGWPTRFEFQYGRPSALSGFNLSFALRGVRLKEGTATVSETLNDRRDPPDILSGQSGPNFGYVRVDAPPGVHTLVFLFDASLVPRSPAATRPTRADWTVATAVDVTITGRIGGDVELVTDPGLDPQQPQGVHRQPAIRLERVRAIDNAGSPVLIVDLHFGFYSIGQAYRVDVIVNGKTYPCGIAQLEAHYAVGKTAKGPAPDLPPDATACTVVLTPDVEQPGIDSRIWGKPVKFENMQIKRDGQ